MEITQPAASRMTTTELLQSPVSLDTISRNSCLAPTGFIRDHVHRLSVRGGGGALGSKADLRGVVGPRTDGEAIAHEARRPGGGGRLLNGFDP